MGESLIHGSGGNGAWNAYLLALFPVKAGYAGGRKKGRTKHGKKGAHARGRGHGRGHLSADARRDPWGHKGQARGQG